MLKDASLFLSATVVEEHFYVLTLISSVVYLMHYHFKAHFAVSSQQSSLQMLLCLLLAQMFLDYLPPFFLNTIIAPSSPTHSCFKALAEWQPTKSRHFNSMCSHQKDTGHDSWHLICNLVDELCPESAVFSPLVMKGIHMPTSMEKLVHMTKVKQGESHA